MGFSNDVYGSPLEASDELYCSSLFVLENPQLGWGVQITYRFAHKKTCIIIV